MHEAESIVSELLENLVEDVCKHCSLNVRDSSGPFRMGPSMNLGEMFELDHVITAFTLLGSKISVAQLKCVDQKASGYCGHYALFFAHVLLEASFSQEKEDVRDYLDLTRDAVAFWKRYWRSVKVLIEHADSQQWWPWTRAHVYTGDMERSFLSHLLSYDPFFNLFGSHHVIVLHYAYGLIQDSADKVCAAQYCLSQFQSSPDDRCVAFVLGVTNHWVTLLLYKSAHNIGVLYLDSNNEPVILASDDDLCNLVAKREEKHLKKKGKLYSKWKRENVLQGFIDQRNVVKLVWECLAGKRDLRSEILSTSWCRLIDSYCECVKNVVSDNQDCDLYMALLLQWLEEHYCPETIQHTHLELLLKLGLVLSEEPVIEQVNEWVKHCQQFLGSVEYSTGNGTIDKFIKCVCRVANALKIPVSY